MSHRQFYPATLTLLLGAAVGSAPKSQTGKLGKGKTLKKKLNTMTF